jgi:uncharacterized protein (TIGR00290 family)
MDNLVVVSSWSGGKDSCLACYKAMQEGYKVKFLLNFISRDFRRGCFHGIEANLLKLQAELIGIALVQKEVSPDMKEYEKEFKEAVEELKLKDIKGMVFGDVYLDEHRIWVERVCNDLGIKAIEPLWNKPAEDVVGEFINLGFKAIVVSCQADKFGKDFVGKEVNRNLIRKLTSRAICPCGENGEFHTLVVDGPIFKRRIEILKSEPVLKEGFWKYWFLDIRKYRVVDKSKI